MGLKKYEIITVGSDKRVRALRSWQVGDRYVNIGDVGGIVYDEKTLSQDGLCWLFKGNFGFPGARIGGDSIVDVGEEAPDVNSPTPDLNILGSSAVVGSKVRFSTTATAADAITLTAEDFEQGGFSALISGTPLTGVNSVNYIRLKKPVFSGGKSVALKCDVPGYTIMAVAVDRDNTIITNSPTTQSGVGVVITVPAGQYFSLSMSKNPISATVPADATAARIKFKGVYKNTINIVDSRVLINPATDTANRLSVVLRGNYPYTTGGEFPPCNIVGSTVNLTRAAATSRSINIAADVENSNVSVGATSSDVVFIGVYSNVKNLVYDLPVAPTTVAGKNGIQATDCNDFAVSPTIFPGLADAQTANMPFIFQGCNVPSGKFYHHAQIKNTYKNIDFAKAQADLGKSIAGGRILASAEVEGMYRLATGTGGLIGSLVESYDSVANLSFSNFATIYGTTIYKDAYFKGIFDIAGTNVFGNTKKHDASNTQDISGALVMGLFNATTNGSTISGVVANNARAVVSQPFRVSGAGGISVQSPAGLECNIYLTDATNKILVNTGYVSGNNAPITLAPTAVYAYIAVRKADGSDILSLDEFKGVTVTTYNGCKIVNTGETAIPMKGNIRVEDNAILVNASVVGSGYFGGNSVAYYNPAVWASLGVNGTVFMKDNAVFAPSVANASAGISLLEMRGDARFAGAITVAGAKHNITMEDNAQFFGTLGSSGGFSMHGNSFVASSGVVASVCRGLLAMKDDARIENGSITAVGYITLCGKYRQTSAKTWTGKRVIDNQDAPEYDNNVKTKYDF